MRNLRYRRTLLLGLMLSCAGLCQERRLGVIDFFGYEGIDLAGVRSALPFHEGEVVPSAADPRDRWKAAARDAITRTVGRPPTDVATVCCTGKGDWMIYIGLPGRSTVSLEYPPVRGRPLQLPAALLSLDAELNDAWVAAVMKGSAREEDATGYALSTDPALRSKQLELRELALKYEHEILDVLSHSSDSRQRAISATALGYTRQSNSQLAALVAASSDPESEVRNNAVRALGVLLVAKPELRSKIPVDLFVNLLRSGSWTDRNKGSFLFLELTAGRDARILSALRTKALTALVEMAKWQEAGHALPARILLGRIAGLPEDRIQELVRDGNVQSILTAAAMAR